MKKIVFMGTPDFSVPILQALDGSDNQIVLVVTQPDRPKGRKKAMTPPPVKIEADKLQIPVLQPEKLKDEYKKVLSYEPDVIITAAYGQLLPKELLSAPPFGCINVHASLLPELRGGAPIHYAILEGKEETGVTIMYMVEKLDAGDILTKQKVSIAKTDHVGSLHDKLSVAGADLLIDTLPKLFANELKPVKQNEHEATFAANIKREEERINWNQSNEEVYNHVRGLHPWPVAFTTYKGKSMKIWWGEMDITDYGAGSPGEIVRIFDSESFIVRCGNGKGFKVAEIQPAGKKRMTVKEYLHGSKDRIQIGTKMGD